MADDTPLEPTPEEIAAELVSAGIDPAGERWIPGPDGHLVRDTSGRATDAVVAVEPLQRQLHAAVRDAVAELAETAARLANSRTWAGLPRTVGKFQQLVAADPERMPDQLGTAYGLLVRLGGFLETNDRLEKAADAAEDPLPPDVLGPLTSLVEVAAPWLRRFPTIAALDDEAGKLLGRAELVPPARDLFGIARAKEVITALDAELMEIVAAGADKAATLGLKAGSYLQANAKNVVLVVAGIAVLRLAGSWLTFETAFAAGALASGYANRSLLIKRCTDVLVAAEKEVEQLTETMTPSVRRAIRGVIGRLKRDSDRETKAHSVSPDAPDIPDDVEERARAMILDGRAPPPEWRPHIRSLDFDGSGLSGVSPLSGLTALQSLRLNGTPVSDVSPLSGLTALQSLGLNGTPVSDVSPLSGLTALQILGLDRTQVSDVSPLSGLTALQFLDLDDTGVSDVSPLSGLTALQTLWLNGTGVSDVSPLSGLTALQTLWLTGTGVSDVSPLSGLTALQSLWLTGTRVSDVSPLSGLTTLQTLSLNGTGVSDVSPLSGLTALQHLYLDDTGVSDVSPLLGIPDLEITLSDGTTRHTPGRKVKTE